MTSAKKRGAANAVEKGQPDAIFRRRAANS